VNLFFQPGISDGVLHLDGDESRHCVKVLRKRIGDPIRITDGKGFYYEAAITDDDERECQFRINEKIAAPERKHFIHLVISPTKNTDRLEWFVEKSVELGVDKISLADCDHTERAFVKPDRLMKVAVSAMKQSLKASLPSIQNLSPLHSIIQAAREDQRFIAFVDHSNPHHLKDLAEKQKAYCILIGPEGDFSPEELALALQHGFRKVSLGSSRLRTETAGLAACHILNLIND
jgi:16S rRNA (uracil1498-N3)-methyltransferase